MRFVSHATSLRDASKPDTKARLTTYLLIYLLTFAVLILASRHAILDDKPTSLSKALSFLVRDYSPTFMWWELVMLWRQLYLVGFALLVMMGTVQQLVISFLVALVYMLLVSVATPFKDDGDNYFSQACSFALAATFLFVLVLKFGELTESVRDTCQKESTLILTLPTDHCPSTLTLTTEPDPLTLLVARWTPCSRSSSATNTPSTSPWSPWA